MTSNEMALMANIAVEMQKNEVNDVLDKIKTEIEQLPITDTAVRLVTEILDKYKAESENKT